MPGGLEGINTGDILICPNGTGQYRAAEITDGYVYAPGKHLPHRRPVRWLSAIISRDSMSEALRNSTGSIGTISDISDFADELEKLLGGRAAQGLVATEKDVNDPIAFAMESHLEDFLVKNWTHTAFGKEYDVYKDEDGEGKQYPVDTGRIDILAVSKDSKRLLVIELKRGRTSDVVVGQTLRYMGYVQDELAEKGQSVHGAIVALEDDLSIRRALAMTRNIEFYRYQVDFKLIKS